MDRPRLSRPRFTPPPRARLRTLAVQLMLLWLMAGSASGCRILIGVIMAVRGRPMIDADFKMKTRRSMTDKGKKTLVLCTAPESVKGDSGSLDLDIITELTRQLRAHDIEMIDPDKVVAWREEHLGDLDEFDLVNLGREMKADFIIQVQLDKFQIRDESSPTLLRGKAQGKVFVTVLEYDRSGKYKPPAHMVYTQPFDSSYPVHQPATIEQVTVPVFRKQFFDRLTDELSRLFYDHRPGETF